MKAVKPEFSLAANVKPWKNVPFEWKNGRVRTVVPAFNGYLLVRFSL